MKLPSYSARLNLAYIGMGLAIALCLSEFIGGMNDARNAHLEKMRQINITQGAEYDRRIPDARHRR